MPALSELHRQARAIFDSALAFVDSRKAVRQALAEISSPSIYSIAIGKAATSMALGLDDALDDRLTSGVVVSSTLHHSNRWRSFIGGHPLPDDNSLAAARAAFALLDQANEEHATVVFLISGGGSAMIEWPIADDISLTDLQRANQVLISCGAHIAEINSVRRAFSAVKGAGLARRAPHANILTLIVSDTNPGDEASVASGPTLAPPTGAPEAIEVVEKYQIENVLPPSIMKAVHSASLSITAINGSHLVLLDNRTAIDAAVQKARELNFITTILDNVSEQPIQEGCDLLVSNIDSCTISGGEFSCPVKGDGRGGRNLETALRCAIQLHEANNKDSHTVVLSAGTDGIDGNSPAAGAIADETTITRARDLHLDPNHYLARSDSYTFFGQLNDLIVTGPTGTNVRDLRIILRTSA